MHQNTQGVNACCALIVLGAFLAAPPVEAAGRVSITATYEARLLLKIADLRTDQVVSDGSYNLGARVTTPGVLGVLKPSTLLVQANGAMVGGVPAPQVFIQTEKNGAKRRVVSYAGGPGDPLSRLLRVAMQSGEASPCIGGLAIYDGRQRYDLTLMPDGAGEGKFTLVRPIRCRMGFHPISGFSGGPPKPNPFMRGDPVATFAYEPRAKIWVMTDVAVPTAVGAGHISLISLHIDGARPDFAKPPPPRPAPRNRRGNH
jgi:hypothetical protein